MKRTGFIHAYGRFYRNYGGGYGFSETRLHLATLAINKKLQGKLREDDVLRDDFGVKMFFHPPLFISLFSLFLTPFTHSLYFSVSDGWFILISLFTTIYLFCWFRGKSN